MNKKSSAAVITELDLLLFILLHIGIYIMVEEKFVYGLSVIVLALALWALKYRSLQDIKESERRAIRTRSLEGRKGFRKPKRR
jgi:hypothetical protein